MTAKKRADIIITTGGLGPTADDITRDVCCEVMGFELVPVDGSKKMPDDLMESIEPYDFSQAVDFQTAYLSGYLADRYDVDSAQSINRANERIKNSSEKQLRSTVTGYSSVMPQKTNVSLSNQKTKYALYPVWILNTTYKGEKFVFAMNGQTGKMIGDIPYSKSKAVILWIVLFVVTFAIMCIFTYLI